VSDTALFPNVSTGGRWPFSSVAIPSTRPTADLLDRAEVLHRQVSDLQSDTAGLRRRGLVHELEDRQQVVAASSGTDLLDVLSDAGFAWRDVARLAQVSVPAVQKWRRGEGMTGANRYKVAKVVALLDVLANHFVSEPASWLEMPVKDGVELSRLGLISEGRFDLVLELISDDGDPVSASAVLDEFRPDWRESLVDNAFEAYVASDGVVSIRPKR
jgi:hypothetical protein